jgi:3-phenylpropionate/trans-cinnamate dioxygenase ferredoxin reductase subunit
VARLAKAARAQCYTDPFVQEPRGPEQASLVSRLTGWLNEPRDSKSVTLQPAQPEGAPRRARRIRAV